MGAAGGYRLLKTGLDAYVEKAQDDKRQTNALRAAATLLSAVIGKGGVRVKDGGSIVIEDGGGILVTENGFMTTVGGAIRAADAVTSETVAYFGRLTSAGADFGTGLLTATSAGSTYFWVAERVGTALKELVFLGNNARVDATDNITLNTPQVRIYGLGDTGSAANLALDVIGGVPVLKRVVSSDRYKTDTKPVEVDVQEVLAYQGITWLHQSTLDETPTPWAVRRNVGHHAEAMHRFPSLRQFVNYDDEGLPASVQEGRFEVALLEVIKVLWQRVDDHGARLDALESN